jgi:hypothetical protein
MALLALRFSVALPPTVIAKGPIHLRPDDALFLRDPGSTALVRPVLEGGLSLMGSLGQGE